MGSVGIEYNFFRLFYHLRNVTQDALNFFIYYDLLRIFVANRALPLSVRRYDEERKKNLEVEALWVSAVSTSYRVFDELFD